jgi:hypothetical protein
MKKILALLSISISILATSHASMAAEKAPTYTYVCTTDKNLVFMSETNGENLVYTAFNGKYDTVNMPDRRADLVLKSGRRSLLNNGKKQSTTWKSGPYMYQIISPTIKADNDFSGYLVVKKNNQTILHQECVTNY